MSSLGLYKNYTQTENIALSLEMTCMSLRSDNKNRKKDHGRYVFPVATLETMMRTNELLKQTPIVSCKNITLSSRQHKRIDSEEILSEDSEDDKD